MQDYIESTLKRHEEELKRLDVAREEHRVILLNIENQIEKLSAKIESYNAHTSKILNEIKDKQSPSSRFFRFFAENPGKTLSVLIGILGLIGVELKQSEPIKIAKSDTVIKK